MAEPRVLYPIHDGPQLEAMKSEAEELLYGGAFGGGKSYFLRAWATNYCLTYPGANIPLFRRSYRELEETHIRYFQAELPNQIVTYRAARHDFEFANGSVIQCRYAESPDDVSTYQTAEWDALLIDEITQFDQLTYIGLLSRVRSTKPWWPGPRVRAAGTPLGVGHVWVKERWVKPADTYQIWKGPISEGGMTRQFIPARVTDNPALIDADPDYIKRLRSLPPEEYRARALGDWDTFTGQFFTQWRPDIHIITPFDIPPDWDKYVAVDYGFNAPYAALWIARPPGTDVAYVYREHYGKDVKLEEQIYRAKQACEDSGDKVKGVIVDPALFGKVNVKGERIDSMANDWMKEFYPVIKGNNDRIPGWRLLREMVDWKEGPNEEVLVSPRLKVFSTCRNLIRTLPTLVMNENNPEDVDSDSEDHAADALRYGLMHMFRGRGQQEQARTYHMTPKGLVVRPSGNYPTIDPMPTGRDKLIPDYWRK